MINFISSVCHACAKASNMMMTSIFLRIKFYQFNGFEKLAVIRISYTNYIILTV